MLSLALFHFVPHTWDCARTLDSPPSRTLFPRPKVLNVDISPLLPCTSLPLVWFLSAHSPDSASHKCGNRPDRKRSSWKGSGGNGGRRMGAGAEYAQIKFPSEIGDGRSWEHSLINNFCICHTEKGNERKPLKIIKMTFLWEWGGLIDMTSTWRVIRGRVRQWIKEANSSRLPSPTP